MGLYLNTVTGADKVTTGTIESGLLPRTWFPMAISLWVYVHAFSNANLVWLFDSINSQSLRIDATSTVFRATSVGTTSNNAGSANLSALAPGWFHLGAQFANNAFRYLHIVSAANNTTQTAAFSSTAVTMTNAAGFNRIEFGTGPDNYTLGMCTVFNQNVIDSHFRQLASGRHPLSFEDLRRSVVFHSDFGDQNGRSTGPWPDLVTLNGATFDELRAPVAPYRRRVWIPASTAGVTFTLSPPEIIAASSIGAASHSMRSALAGVGVAAPSLIDAALVAMNHGARPAAIQTPSSISSAALSASVSVVPPGVTAPAAVGTGALSTAKALGSPHMTSPSSIDPALISQATVFTVAPPDLLLGVSIQPAGIAASYGVGPADVISSVSLDAAGIAAVAALFPPDMVLPTAIEAALISQNTLVLSPNPFIVDAGTQLYQVDAGTQRFNAS